MHGLYEFASPAGNGGASPMQAVLARMIASLKPGGFLVMALAHRDEAALPSFCDYLLLTTYYVLLAAHYLLP